MDDALKSIWRRRRLTDGGNVICSDSFARGPNMNGTALDNAFGGSNAYTWNGTFNVANRVGTFTTTTFPLVVGLSIADVRLSSVVIDDNTGPLGLIARSDATAANCYFGYFQIDHFAIFKLVAGVATSLTGSVFVAAPRGAVVTFDVIGNNLRTYINGTLAANITDATFAAAGQVGIGTGAAGMQASGFIAEHIR